MKGIFSSFVFMGTMLGFTSQWMGKKNLESLVETDQAPEEQLVVNPEKIEITEEKNEDFWCHEWEKHGTCMFDKSDEFDYFKKALSLFVEVHQSGCIKDYPLEKNGLQVKIPFDNEYNIIKPNTNFEDNLDSSSGLFNNSFATVFLTVPFLT